MTPRKCPICKRAVSARPGEPPFPFCSPRCKLVDLGNWLDARYVATTPLDPEGENEPPPAAPPEHE